MLELILIDTYNREYLVRDFQKRIRNTTLASNDEIIKVYNKLADTLYYYEPNEEIQNKDPSNFGGNRLIWELEQALNKIKKFQFLYECFTWNTHTIIKMKSKIRMP